MKRILLTVMPALLLLSSCSKDINNKDALRAAVVDYYNNNQDKLGLSMTNMDVEIGSMSFQKDQATATVSIKPKGGGEGMQISKVFDRKGDKWVVRGNLSSGPGGHGAGMALPNSAPAGGPAAMPPGHPSTGGATAPTGPLPAGHPAVSGAPKQ